MRCPKSAERIVVEELAAVGVAVTVNHDDYYEALHEAMYAAYKVRV